MVWVGGLGPVVCIFSGSPYEGIVTQGHPDWIPNPRAPNQQFTIELPIWGDQTMHIHGIFEDFPNNLALGDWFSSRPHQKEKHIQRCTRYAPTNYKQGYSPH